MNLALPFAFTATWFSLFLPCPSAQSTFIPFPHAGYWGTTRPTPPAGVTLNGRPATQTQYAIDVFNDGVTFLGAGSPAVAPIDCSAGPLTKWWPVCSIDGTTANSDACVGFNWPLASASSLTSYAGYPSAASVLCTAGSASATTLTSFVNAPSPSGNSGFATSGFIPRALTASTRVVCVYSNSTSGLNATTNTVTIRHWIICYAAAATLVVDGNGNMAVREVLRAPGSLLLSSATAVAGVPAVAQVVAANEGFACYITSSTKSLSCVQLFAAGPGVRPTVLGFSSSSSHAAVAGIPAAWSNAWAAGTAYAPGSLTLSDAMLCAMRDIDGMPDCFAVTDSSAIPTRLASSAGSRVDAIGVAGGFPVPPTQAVVVTGLWASPAADTFCAMHQETANSMLRTDVQAASAASLFQRLRCYGAQSPMQTGLPSVIAMPRPLSSPWIASVSGGGGAMAAVMTTDGQAVTTAGTRTAWAWGRGLDSLDMRVNLTTVTTGVSGSGQPFRNSTRLQIGSFYLTKSPAVLAAVGCGLTVRLYPDGSCDGTTFNGSVASKNTYSDPSQCDAVLECEQPLIAAVGSPALTALRAAPARSMCAGIGILCVARATNDSMVCAVDYTNAGSAVPFTLTASGSATTSGWSFAVIAGRFTSLTCGKGFVCGYEQINGSWACYGNSAIAASVAVPSGLGLLGALSAGTAHVCALRLASAAATSGPVSCWGAAASSAAVTVPGALASTSFDYVVAMRDSTCGVTSAGLFKCWGALAARAGFLSFLPQKPGSYSFSASIRTRVWNVSSAGSDALCSTTRVCKTLAAAVALCPSIYCTIYVLDDTSSAPVTIPTKAAGMSIIGIPSAAGVRPTVTISIASSPPALVTVLPLSVTIRNLQLSAGGATVFATSATSFAAGECNEGIRIAGRYATLDSVGLTGMLCQSALVATSGRIIAGTTTSSAANSFYDIAIKGLTIGSDAAAPIFVSTRGHERVSIADVALQRSTDAANRLPAAFMSVVLSGARLLLDFRRISVSGFTAGTAADGGSTCGSVLGVFVDGATFGSSGSSVSVVDVNATNIGNAAVTGALACLKLNTATNGPTVQLQNVRVSNATAAAGALLYTLGFSGSLASPVASTSFFAYTITNAVVSDVVGADAPIMALNSASSLTVNGLSVNNATSDGADSFFVQGSSTSVTISSFSVQRSTARMWPLMRCLCTSISMTAVSARNLEVSDGAFSGLSPPAAAYLLGTGSVTLSSVTIDGLLLPLTLPSGSAVHALFVRGSLSSSSSGPSLTLSAASPLQLLRIRMTTFATAADAANAAFLGLVRASTVTIPASSITLTTTAPASGYSVALLRAMGCFGAFSVNLPAVVARKFLGAVVFVDASGADNRPSSLSLTGVTATEVACDSAQDGCAVHLVAAGAVTLSSVTVSNTWPARNGGAVFVATRSSSLVTFNVVTIRNATASGTGGGIHVEGTGTTSTFTAGGAITVQDTTAGGAGGGMYVGMSSSCTVNGALQLASRGASCM